MEKIELTGSKKLTKAKKKKLERLYDKKPLLELIVAILSIPSLILLVILNFNSLKNLTSAKPTPTPISATVAPMTNSGFYAAPVTRQPRPTQSSILSQEPCIKGLGPISITSPNENDTVTTNPVEIDISYDDSKYCEAVWSYSINGGQWSDYDNNSVALYNLPDGAITFDLRVKSVTNSDTTSLIRHFTYTGQSTAILPTTASGSAQ